MKKWLLLSALCLSALLLTGCAGNSGVTELYDRRPMVMIEGRIYLDTGKEISETIGAAEIDGEISSSVAGSEVPTQNATGNFDCVGAKYALYQEGIALDLDGRWFFFEPEED